MRIYDVTLTISEALPVWPGDPAVVLQRVSRIEAGDEANVTHIDMGAHTGTHVDAPYHFLGDGAVTVDRLPLETLTGRAYLLRLPDEVESISAAVLDNAHIPPRTRRLLLRTRNSDLWARGESRFQTDFVAIGADAAGWLVQRGVRLVGVDYLSVAPYEATVPTHQILLQAGVIVLEGLDLSQVEQGSYRLYCLPLKLGGADGAPARAILEGD